MGSVWQSYYDYESFFQDKIISRYEDAISKINMVQDNILEPLNVYLKDCSGTDIDVIKRDFSIIYAWFNDIKGMFSKRKKEAEARAIIYQTKLTDLKEDGLSNVFSYVFYCNGNRISGNNVVGGADDNNNYRIIRYYYGDPYIRGLRGDLVRHVASNVYEINGQNLNVGPIQGNTWYIGFVSSTTKTVVYRYVTNAWCVFYE